MEIKTVLKEQFKDLITDDTLSVLEEAFQTSVNEKVEVLKGKFNQKLSDRTDLIKEASARKIVEITKSIDEDHTEKLHSLVESIDRDHAGKLQRLLGSIDTDHTVKLQKLVESIDRKHTKMLRAVINKYEKALGGKASEFRERVVEEVSNYLDLYLDKVVPVNQISEAVENIRSKKQLDEVRRIVGLDDSFISDEIKGAIKDGKRTIEQLRENVQQVVSENEKLKGRADRAEATMLLNEQTSNMTEVKKFYVNKMLKNKSPEYIKENLEYVSQMFDKEQEQDVEEARKEVITERKRARQMVDVPQEVLEENISHTNEIERKRPSSEGGVSDYLIEMQKLSRFSAKR